MAACLVLVVDDEAPIRELVADILRSEGYEVSVAADGVGALQMLTSRRPTLVILDMRMPGLTGWDVVAEMRARHIEVPVVVMTAARSARQWAEEVGAVAYLAKPFDLTELLDTVERLCGSADALPTSDNDQAADTSTWHT